MPYYDVVGAGCAIDGDLERRLGFKKIYSAERTGFAFGADQARLLAAARNGANVCITDMNFDNKTIDAIRLNGKALCIPVSAITQPYGFKRARSIFQAISFYKQAKKAGVRTTFISMAGSNGLMVSSIQLIELAAFVCGDDRYARHCVGVTNKELVD